MEGSALQVRETETPMELSVTDVLAQVKKIQEVMRLCMKEGEHYGVIPGTNKPTLLKPGAEKLLLVFRFDPQYESTEIYDGDHLTIKSRCNLYHIPTGLRMGSGEGSCSTKESKYAYRNASLTCPECGKDSIIKGKYEFGGGWLCFKKKGGCGAKFPDQQFEGAEVGKIPNDALPDQYNTVLKMANKRSLVAAVLNATAASDIFTQDLEDMAENGQKFHQAPTQTKKEKPEEAKPMPINYKQALADALKNYCGDSKKASNFLFELTKESPLAGVRFVSSLTEVQAKEIHERFEREYLQAAPEAR